ncbi:23S rRNA (pseudouridine(1915)-N(3))-methyltransferase RlmH [Rhodoligotrophos defluvii]|uniref:23S rRNA (pseudouridine(1915)-N(3))-methyltransferase RlmH n=1 Tax=Rhodoligotrophos defluvii TaxID=2561934 RepID=UPI0010C96EE9|nr:23S rRNA (pseudouridine(1915)-N(3))-methyltransferase RlmH [Rhodoligotrophos defluvii]
MRLSLIAIGRQKRGPEYELFDIYRKRTIAQGRSLGITAVSLKELPEAAAGSPALRQDDEAQRLLQQVPDRAVAVTLDERGRELTSEGFAEYLKAWLEGGAPEVSFLLGGPDGHGQQVRDAAKLVLALGRMTWPHGLARVLLMEQIYRSVTILLNHPYHRA